MYQKSKRSRRYIMDQSTLNVRINSNDKTRFEKFCTDTGINVSVAINMFIKTVLREQRLPFEIKSTNFDNTIYNKLKEAEDEMENNNLRYSSDEVFNSMKDIVRNV